MVQFKFTREFRHWAERSRKRCVLCKALSLIVHPPGVSNVDEATARAAIDAGAGTPLASLHDAETRSSA